eukprot:maker-scaffold_47-snap-gene-0.48-mRNA-1 protein AED:0.03 eAED:0.03 QI:113/0.5/0.66/1/0.5/1/3/0/542
MTEENKDTETKNLHNFKTPGRNSLDVHGVFSTLQKLNFDGNTQNKTTPDLNATHSSTEFSIVYISFSGVETPPFFKSDDMDIKSPKRKDFFFDKPSFGKKLNFDDLRVDEEKMFTSESMEEDSLEKKLEFQAENSFLSTASTTFFTENRKVRQRRNSPNINRDEIKIQTPATGRRRINANFDLNPISYGNNIKKLSFRSPTEDNNLTTPPSNRRSFAPMTTKKQLRRKTKCSNKTIANQTLLDLTNGKINISELVFINDIAITDFSHVTLMRNTSNNRKVILKESKSTVVKESTRRELLEEIEIYKYLAEKEAQCGRNRIKYIMEYFGAWIYDSSFRIVCEYCNLGSLDKINQLETEKSLFYMLYSICSGLSLLHENNVVHLDLKPENILLKNDVNNVCIKIGDLGFANFVDNPNRQKEFEGDARYVSPEVFSAFSIEEISLTGFTPLSDMFAVGLILLRLFSGQPMPKGGEYWQKLRSEKPFEENWSLQNKQVEEIISSLVVKNLNLRKSSSDIIIVLEQLLEKDKWKDSFEKEIRKKLNQ